MQRDDPAAARRTDRPRQGTRRDVARRAREAGRLPRGPGRPAGGGA